MPKPCDACQEANAVVYCKADTAYLCVGCDSKVHGANKLASRHERVWMCEVCEQAPAVVTCKADAAALCVSCDNDIHSANPLASRHERIPVTPFFDSPNMDKFAHANGQVQSLLHDEQECSLMLKEEEEENSAVEAASWLLPHPNSIPRQVTGASDKDGHPEDDKEDSDMENSFYSKSSKEYIKGHTMDLFSDVDPYLDLDFVSAMGALQPATDSLVPIHGTTELLTDSSPVTSNESETYDIELQHKAGHGYCPPDLSMSSSSVDVGVVPDASLSDISTPHSNMSVFDFSQRAPNLHHATPLEPLAREARVLRYREKRKNRKFEKTIRYASRKAYAETRPRIKGRFAKRTTEAEVEQMYAVVPDGAFGVVPSF